MPSPAYDGALNSFPEFVDGEKMIGTTDTLVVPPFTSYYFARKIALLPGRYTIKMAGFLAASFWVGSGLLAMRMVCNTASPGQGGANLIVRSEEFEVYEPNARIDVYLHNTDVVSRGIGFAFSLWRNGTLVYATSKDDWLYQEDGPIPDDQLLGGTDIRRDYPVFSLLPNWRDGMLERLEWLTDVIVGEQASEQRRRLRTLPRRSIEASFLRAKGDRARLSNFLVGQGTRPFLVPLWFEQYKLPTALAASATGVVFPENTLGMREFRDGDLVFICNKNPNVFDVAIIDKVDIPIDSFTWEIKPTRTWPAGSRIIPMRLARIVDQASLTNITDAVGQSNIRFELLEPDTGFAPDWGYCAPLFKFKPNWADPVTNTFDRVTSVLDNSIASTSIVDTSDQSRIGQRMNFILRGREQVFAYRRFLAAAAGRSTRFYAPTMTNDVLPTGDISGSSFEAVSAQFTESMKTRQFARQKIAIYFRDNSPPVYRDIVSIQPVGLQTSPTRMDAERYFVDVDLPPITLSRIAKISWVATVRFDQDGFELQHDVAGSNVVRAALVMRSIDPLNMPPIDCWVTSRPYPIDTFDGISVDAVITGSMYNAFISTSESLEADAEITSGSMIGVGYLNQAPTPDNFDVDSEITSGSMTQVIYTTYPVPADLLNVGAVIESGSLQLALVQYHIPPDALSADATITEGSLYV